MYFKIYQIVNEIWSNLRPVIGHWFTITVKHPEKICRNQL